MKKKNQTIQVRGQIDDLNYLSRRKIDIIWNTTLICPWDCALCCVDAVHVKRKNGNLELRSESLTQSEYTEFDSSAGSIYDNALLHRQKLGLELTFEKKLQVLKNLDGYNVKIDISGGDPLAVRENYTLLKEASAFLGRENVTLTATGAGLSKYRAMEIAPFISEMNFTYDSDSSQGGNTRPNNYAAGNLKKAMQFQALGVKTRAELPLTGGNAAIKTLTNIYEQLHGSGIDKLLLMRLFPVGRGVIRAQDIPTKDQYRLAISTLRTLEEKYRTPVLKLQCALKFFDQHFMNSQNPCDMVTESFGLTPTGLLLASPWAINAHGKPMNDAWILGNLSEQHIGDILTSPKARYLFEKANTNFGHCKIFSYLNSKKENHSDRILDVSDPLYQL